MTADNTGKESLAVHRLDLARELLDDIELNQIPPENLLFKASRLARLMEASDIQRWINFELKGYLGEEGYEQDSLPYLLKTGRAKKQKDEKDPSQVFGYFQSFAEMLAWIGSMETELSGLKIPDINYAPSSANPSEMVGGYFGGNIMAATKPANDALARMKFLTAEIGKVRGIVSKIRAFLHDFVAQTYYELAFRGVAESIFDSHKRQVDMLLAASAGDTLQKIPAISERLASGDTEAISHAMSTCRRVLSAFADSVQPPTSEKLPLGEKLLD